MSLRALAALSLGVLGSMAACSLANAPDEVVPEDDDGNGGQGGASTSTANANGGGCQTAANCGSLDDECHVGTCTNGMCEAEPANAGGPCNDNDACTDDDVCGGDGTCAGIAIMCPVPTDACKVAACDAARGGCFEETGNDGGACDDGNGCTGDGACQGGTCLPGSNACTVSNTCGFEFCDQATKTCKVNALNEGQPCDVGNNCAQSTCVAGTCMGLPINEGFPCDDGQFCTFDELCEQGVCTAPAGDPCPDDTTCGTWDCNEATDACDVTPVNEGNNCNDGSVCTSGEKCTAGSCVGMTVPTIFLKEDFSDNSAGWTLGPEWQIGPAKASCCSTIIETADPDLDHTLTSDNGVAGVAIGGNAGINLHPYFYLESPPFNTSAAQSVILGFYRWLNSDYDPYMHNRIEVFNGSTWVIVWQSPPPPANIIQDSPPAGIGWTYIQHDITAHKAAGMRVRFGFDVAQAGVYTIGSWNIDDVLVATLGCP